MKRRVRRPQQRERRRRDRNTVDRSRRRRANGDRRRTVEGGPLGRERFRLCRGSPLNLLDDSVRVLHISAKDFAVAESEDEETIVAIETAKTDNGRRERSDLLHRSESSRERSGADCAVESGEDGHVGRDTQMRNVHVVRRDSSKTTAAALPNQECSIG